MKEKDPFKNIIKHMRDVGVIPGGKTEISLGGTIDQKTSSLVQVESVINQVMLSKFYRISNENNIIFAPNLTQELVKVIRSSEDWDDFEMKFTDFKKKEKDFMKFDGFSQDQVGTVISAIDEAVAGASTVIKNYFSYKNLN